MAIRVSTMVTDREKLLDFIEEFFVQYRDPLSVALRRILEDMGPPGEEPPPAAPDEEPGAVRTGAALLKRTRSKFNVLASTEEAHLNEQANDVRYRSVLETERTNLRDVTIKFRDIFDAAYSKEVSTELGFERRIAWDPTALVRQTTRLVGCLKDHNYVLPESPIGAEVSREKAVLAIEPPLQRLKNAMQSTTSERTKFQGTKVGKDEAMQEYDEAYAVTVPYLVATFRAARLDELAARLEPKIRKGSSRSNPETEPPPTEPPATEPPAVTSGEGGGGDTPAVSSDQDAAAPGAG